MQGFATATDMRLVGWDGTQWIDLSGSANATGNTENSTLSGTIPAGTTITAIGIGSLNTPLPVHFSSFTVKENGCSVQVNWSTAMEINNNHFLVERSKDGSVFTTIAQVQGAGNSSETRHYSYLDQHPDNGTNYYRIRQVDKDGSSSFTQVQSVRVHCMENTDIKVYPTVSSDEVHVILPPGYEAARVELVTTLGQKIAVPIEVNNLHYRIKVDRLAAAMYLIHIVKGTAIHTYKIIRE